MTIEASPAAMPSREAIEAEILPMTYDGADLTECVERVFALFTPILAEKEREIDIGKMIIRNIHAALGLPTNEGAYHRIDELEARALAAEQLSARWEARALSAEKALEEWDARGGKMATDYLDEHEKRLAAEAALANLKEEHEALSHIAGIAMAERDEAKAALEAERDVMCDLMNAAGHYRLTHSEDDRSALTAAIKSAADYMEAAAIRAQGE